MESTRNNFDKPPTSPGQTWSGQQDGFEGNLSRTASDQSWVHSSGDDFTGVESSFEILNEFTSIDKCSMSTTRPSTSPHSIELSSPAVEDSYKLPSSQPTTPGPVPAPRKRTSSQISPRPSRFEIENRKLVQEIEELQRKKNEVDSALARVTQSESNLKTLNAKIATENIQFQRDKAHTTQRLQGLEEELTCLKLSQLHVQSPVLTDVKLAEVKEELEQKTAEVSSLLSQNRELDRKCRAMRMESLNASISGISTRTGTKTSKRIEVRLEETIRELREKEKEIGDLKEQLDAQNTSVICELEKKLKKITKEKEALQQKHFTEAVQQKQQLEATVQQLSGDLFSTQSKLSDLQTHYSVKSEELSQLTRNKEIECEELQEQLSALEDEYEVYKQNHTTSQEETGRTTDQLTSVNATLREQLETMTSDRDLLRQKYSTLSEDNKKKFDRCNELDREVRRLKGDRQRDTVSMGKMLDEIQKEAGDTLGNFNTTVDELKKVEHERDEFRMKHEHSLNVLAARNRDFMAAEAALRQCETTWSKRMEVELEKERAESEQARQVIDVQMSTYRDDFNEERMAREKMAGEKFQLELALKAKNEEILALKQKLNDQAVRVLQDDDFEQSTYPDEGPPLRAQDPGHTPYQHVHYHGHPGQNY